MVVVTNKLYVGGYSDILELFHVSYNDDYDGDDKITNVTVKHVSSSKVLPNPTFLAIHETKLYAIHELDDYEGKPCGAVSVIETATTTSENLLKTLQCEPSAGKWTCHITLDTPRRCAYVTSYLTPYLSVTALKQDGGLGTDVFTRCYADVAGSGVVPDRQEASHPHSAYVHGKFIYVADLGCDRIWHYEHTESGTIVATSPEFTPTPAGSGPRHMAFHHTHNLVYLLTELTNQVIVYRVCENGCLETIGSYDYLPSGCGDGNNMGAEIMLHPNGEFLYVSNRVMQHGVGSLVCFKVLGGSGGLELVERTPLLHTWPRYFVIEGRGNLLLCFEQFKNLVEVFVIEKRSGKLNKVQTVECKNSPACAVFLEDFEVN